MNNGGTKKLCAIKNIIKSIKSFLKFAKVLCFIIHIDVFNVISVENWSWKQLLLYDESFFILQNTKTSLVELEDSNFAEDENFVGLFNEARSRSAGSAGSDKVQLFGPVSFIET